MKSPSTPLLSEEEEALTPTTAKRRGFNFFTKRVQSPSPDVDASPRRLSYQPRMKPSANRIIQPQSRDALSPLQIPKASTSKLSDAADDASARDQIKRRSTPGRIHIDHSAQVLSNTTIGTPASPQEASITSQDDFQIASTSARSPDDITPKAIPPLTHKRRQPSHVLEGMLRNTKNRQPSWSSERHPRSGMKRSVSSPVETKHPSTPRQKEPIAGSKPVAPSFHPDAPDELKVKPPSNPVLLPFLSIPGLNKGDDSNTPPNQFSPTSPPDFNAESVLKSAKIKHQRPGIKVRIITWNQGSSVPRGNLEALLGRVGEYIAPQEGWDESSDEEEDGEEGKKRRHKGMGVAGQEGIPRKDRIPPLPHDDAHPYHVVVVAGQECPWGDGKRIATGVGIAGELGDLGRSKSRAAQHLRDKNKEPAAKGGKVTKDGDKFASDDKVPSSAIEGEFPFSEASNRGVPSTPLLAVPSTPGGGPGIGTWGIGGKGYSDMCEDWLCRGPLAQATATKGLAQASKSISTPSPLSTPLATPDDGLSPVTSRATTPLALPLRHSGSMASLKLPPLQNPIQTEGEKVLTPSLSSKAIREEQISNSPSRKALLAVPRPHNIARHLSLASRSKEVLDATSTSLAGSEDEDEEGILSASPTSRPLSPIKQSIDANIRLPAHQNKHIPGKPHHRLGLHIPGLSAAHHVTVQSDGTPHSLGAYELVAKERCYMMYMAVYVWRGCLDRVVKTSQGHVKSGLLAGRVGNKGCVGISLKLGSSRLLFVNSHLAAHEGKIAERIANIEKIKKELKVDTFLPPEDPRNQADDVTDAFDYAFWMGDLNFRVDISRQHADWLLMKKQYQDALAFDQLTKVMKEQPKVFNGFSEAPITFPPTFKYDVLKTIKHKNEEKARKLKAAANPSKAVDSDGYSIEASKSSSALPTSSVIAESIGQPSKGQANGLSRDNESGLLRESRREDADDDASSITSSAWGSSAPSASGAQVSNLEGRRGSVVEGDSSFMSQSPTVDLAVSSNTAAAEGHKFHGKVVKAKKRFFDIVHAIGSHAQNKEEEYVPEVVKLGRKMKKDALRKQSYEDETNPPHHIAIDEYDGNVVILSASGDHIQSESNANTGNEAANLQMSNGQRRLSVGDISESDTSRLYSTSAMQPSSDVSAMTEEYDRQPYDTSVKQRVPSWCDRVLWKSNVRIEGEEEHEYESSSHGLSSRMGQAISNAIHSNRRYHHSPHHPKTDTSPTVTFATLRPTLRQERSMTSPVKDLSSLPSEGRSASPRKAWFIRRSSGLHMKRSSTMDPQHLGSGAKSRSATDLPAILARSLSARSDVIEGRHQPSPPRPRKSSLEASRQRSVSPLSDQGDNHLIEEHANKHRIVQEEARRSPKHHTASPSYDSNRSSPAPVVKSAPALSADRRTSWWNDLGSHLPSFLTPAFNSLSLHNEDENEQAPKKADVDQELIGPKKGEIECLTYRSLTDAEMRALDARSDHYAVYSVFSIGV